MIFFITSTKKNFITKIRPIFDELAKPGKSTQDTYNRGGWLILEALLKNGVAEGVASESHDTKYLGCFNVMKLEYNKSALQRSNRLAVRTKEKLQTASPIPTFLTKDIVRSS